MTEAPPSRWLVLRVPDPGEGERRELLVEALRETVPHGVEERDDALVAYLPDPGQAAEAVARWVGERLAHAVGVSQPLLVETAWQPHEAWSDLWRQGFKPRRITPRLVVAPSWAPPEPGPGDVVLTLDPGMAFGTAEHPTTRGCLRLLDARIAPGDRMADIGAGSGVLSIAAALLGAERVVAVELDPWAVTAARENVEANGVGDRVEVRAGAVGPAFLPGEAPFHGIVANIEAGILLPLLPGFRGGLEPGGWLILSGILADEACRVVEAAGALGLELEAEDREDAWWSGAFRVPSAPPPEALTPA
jgi:ribosomal protein L11 methyltransferase